MPILVKCSCGKAVNVKDELAGKAIKCPGCGQPVKVVAAVSRPAAATATAKAAPARPVAQQAATKPAVSAQGLDDLFAEEGFNRTIEAVCPSCRAEMSGSAVFCTKCGYNKQTGERMESHKTAGVDISHGEVALQKAQSDLVAEREMQKKLEAAGMPWWLMGTILILLVGATTIAVVAINTARRVDGAGNFNPLATFLMLGFGLFVTISQGANLMLIIKAFQKSVGTGLMAIFVPFYMLYFIATNFKETWRLFAVAIVAGGVAGGFLAGAFAAGL